MRAFQPVSTGLCILSCSHKLIAYPVPKSVNELTMFDKIMGTDRIGLFLEKKLPPEQIVESYTSELEEFKNEREDYLIPFYLHPDF